MKIISVSNQKGGVGKTTTVINLSSALAIIDKKVLVIDLDPQGNASTSININIHDRQTNIYHLFTQEENINKIIKKTEIPNLDIIPSTIDLASIDLVLKFTQNKEHILKYQISQLTEKYDYIFIDCGPALNTLTLNAFIASHSVLVPIQAEFLAMEGITYLMQTIKLAQQQLNPDLQIEGIIITMFDTRNRLCHSITEELRSTFQELVYQTQIPRNIKLPEAQSYGKPIFLYDMRCTGSIYYMMFAKEFLERQ